MANIHYVSQHAVTTEASEMGPYQEVTLVDGQRHPQKEKVLPPALVSCRTFQRCCALFASFIPRVENRVAERDLTHSFIQQIFIEGPLSARRCAAPALYKISSTRLSSVKSYSETSSWLKTSPWLAMGVPKTK